MCYIVPRPITWQFHRTIYVGSRRRHTVASATRSNTATRREGRRFGICLHSVAFPVAMAVCAAIWRVAVHECAWRPHTEAPPARGSSTPVWVTQSNKSNVIHTNILVARRVIFTLVLPCYSGLYARWYYYSDDYGILYAYNKIINKGWSILLRGAAVRSVSALTFIHFTKVTIEFISTCLL